jgi:hypothetical protein
VKKGGFTHKYAAMMSAAAIGFSMKVSQPLKITKSEQETSPKMAVVG